MSTHEFYDQLAVGHALSALEPEDEQLFLAHLPGCAACERALTEHHDTLGHLAYGVAGDAPPPAVLEGIRAGVVASGRSGTFPPPLSMEAARTRRRDKTVRWTTVVVGAAAAVVMVAALVFVNRGLTSREHQAQNAAANLSRTVASLLVPGARKVELAGDHGGQGAVVVNGSSIALVMAGVPVNDQRSSIYVLWEKSLLGDVRAVGTFDVGSSQLAVVNNLRLSQRLDTVKSFIVTREQGRTAPRLSSQPAVVAGDA